MGQDRPPLADQLAGGEFDYVVERGDSLTRIGARFGVSAGTLAALNNIAPASLLKVGQRLRVDNRHIVADFVADGIIINIPQRMLFYFKEGRLMRSYPVALGRPDWPTPTGRFKIIVKEENPTWEVPQSIQEEMRSEGKAVETCVPPGPDNPLGQYWLGLSIGGYGIHGTIAPASIYHFQTHGCIRLHPDDIAELFDRVKVGTPGRLIYQPVLLAVLDDGRILLEVHRDIYNKGIDPVQTARGMAEANGLSRDIDWSRADAVIAAQEGLAREVGRRNR
jgi:L,D-transpeptidase ErfK/SrfK